MLYVAILVLIIILLCVGIGAASSSKKTNQLAQKKMVDERREMELERRNAQKKADSEFGEEWELLCRYDSIVRPQVERLEPFGEGAVAELKRVYKITKDKEGLREVADQIIADAQSGKFDPNAIDAGREGENRGDMFGPEDVDEKGFTPDRDCQVFDTYQVRKHADGTWRIETRAGEPHPLFKKRFFHNLGTAKRKAAEKLGK